MPFTRAIRYALWGTLLLVPAMALGQPTSAPAPDEGAARAAFGGLWTRWGGASEDAIRAEAQAAQAARAGAAAAEGPRHYQAGSAALGERVGEVVRIGDCEEGERLAREAGDFPLVNAVRTHCRPRPQAR